jgi:hypothetical protein
MAKPAMFTIFIRLITWHEFVARQCFLPDLDGGESFLPDFDTFLRDFDTFFPGLAGGGESFLPEFDLPCFILEKL